MRKQNSKIRTNFISESGTYLQNKDYFAFVEFDKYAIYVIADGIDEDKDLTSSKIAIKKVISEFSEKQSFSKRYLNNILKKTSEELKKASIDRPLKASLTVIVSNYSKFRYATIGNTRLYLIRDGFIKYQSKDQSLSQMYLDEEKIPKDKAQKHEERNNLYCYLGQKSRLTPYISRKYKLEESDTIVLCTRGMWENLSEGEILDALDEVKDPIEANDNLEELILVKNMDEFDNYTIATIFVDKTYTNPKLKKLIKKILIITIILLLIIGTFAYFAYKKHKEKIKNIEDMNFYKQSAQKYIEEDNYVRGKEEFNSALNLAKKLRDEEERDYIDKRVKLLELILRADEEFKEEKYEKAFEKFKKVKDDSYYLDNIALDYVNDRLFLINKHIEVLDLIKRGENQFLLDNLYESEMEFIKARDLAREIYFISAKEEAIDKLDKIYEKKKIKDKKQEEEELKQEEELKKEMEEELKNNIKLQESATKAHQDANKLYNERKYEDSLIHYKMAQVLYEELGMKDMQDIVEQKMKLIEKLIKNDFNVRQGY